MFERATDDVIALAAAAAAAVVGVIALGFAIYAFASTLGAPPYIAALIVAVAAAVTVSAFAFVASIRARAKERAAAEAQAQLAQQLPHNIADLAREHPFAALAMSVVGGAVAARHPKLARDLLSLVARFSTSR